VNRNIIIPTVALLALVVKQISGVELDNVQIDIIVEGILGVAAIIGIFTNPKR
jgi:uncharacterized membrane protein